VECLGIQLQDINSPDVGKAGFANSETVIKMLIL
jgi:hypothetical protein